MQKQKPKIIVVVGPTASGKSNLAVKLAQAFNGEVISADSRQIYTGLDIGSGKITPAEMGGVPHHMLDIVSPKKVFTVTEFQKIGQEKIADILNRGKLPIICGGSGFYIDALVDSTVFPEVPPNTKLRGKLEKKSLKQLCTILKKLDPRRLKEIDTANSRRLVRAIEIATALGSVPKPKKKLSQYAPLYIGTLLPNEILKEKIHRRLESRMKDGMLTEVENLHKNGVSWKRLEKFGLEYRRLALFLKNRGTKKEITLEATLAELEQDTNQYAKRQRTWFKRNLRIKWFDPEKGPEVNTCVKSFLYENTL